jgi:hypothetical protein
MGAVWRDSEGCKEMRVWGVGKAGTGTGKCLGVTNA